jgi:hypothetical protein
MYLFIRCKNINKLASSNTIIQEYIAAFFSNHYLQKLNITRTSLNPPHLCACPNAEHIFSSSYVAIFILGKTILAPGATRMIDNTIAKILVQGIRSRKSKKGRQHNG